MSVAFPEADAVSGLAELPSLGGSICHFCGPCLFLDLACCGSVPRAHDGRDSPN